MASGRPSLRPCVHHEDAVPLSEKSSLGACCTTLPPTIADGSLMTRPPTETAFPSRRAFGPRFRLPHTATAFPRTVPLIVFDPSTATAFPSTVPSTVRGPMTATAFPSRVSFGPT